MPRPIRSPRHDWKPVSSRISPELRDKILQKHPNEGDLSKLIKLLLEKYIDGRILGVRLET